MRLRILLTALLTASACVAQSPLEPITGPLQFSGTIYRVEGSQVGAPIAGADLTVMTGVNANAKATTNGSGRYVFNGLEGGSFTVFIAAPGYVTATPVVNLFRHTEANFGLKPE
jgi:hypothetical protein